MTTEPENSPLLPTVSPKDFKKWRSPKRGEKNPHPMNNPLWEWAILSEKNAYAINSHFKGPSPFKAGACWCFDRMGQTSTKLSDGRIVYIAGEHEDYYDPDFYIYNDVIVKYPNGKIEIFGYPTDQFIPTDFHSATLLGEKILVVGNLGREADQKQEQTPIFQLDTQTWEISAVQSTGESPGWVYKHKVSLSEDHSRLLLTGGLLRNSSFLENLEDWELNLTDWSWRKLTDRRWSQWVFKRTDGKMNQLSAMRRAQLDLQLGGKLKEEMQKLLAEMPPEIAKLILPKEDFSLDLELLHSLYHPPVSEVPAINTPEDEYNIYRLQVAGVTVRYQENINHIIITIEGDLPETSVQKIITDLKSKLTTLEKCEYTLEKHPT